ncbi:MAG: LuxR C-terminal-related transcriptional regulator [bacterium]
MMAGPIAAETLDRGRAAFERRAYTTAFSELSAAEQESPLSAEDLDRLATAAHMIGRETESVELWSRAHNEFIRQGAMTRAARSAIWLGFALGGHGQAALSAGWFGRARRLLDDAQVECVEQGYLLLPEAVHCMDTGECTRAYDSFTKAAKIGERFAELDLMTYARHGQGRTLIRLGEVARGVALLDEIMVAVTSREVSPIVSGVVYCSVIEACDEIFDLRRAQEWTAAFSDWCESEPEMAPHRGTCLVRRAEIMQIHGEWPAAMDEAQRARERLSDPPHPEAGLAFYQVAELYRLRGEFAQADQAYRQASQFGCKPQPGLSLLRLAQGQIDSAKASITRAVTEARDHRSRGRVLTAFVEIMLAAGDIPAARAAADEMSQIAVALDAPMLRALSTMSTGAVLIAEGRAEAAIAELLESVTLWRRLSAPYEAGRVRVLAGIAYRAMGDEESAEMEFDAARRVFNALGAQSDLDRIEAAVSTDGPKATADLTSREVEVLRLVATGKTNRVIAESLGISEKTVARHLSNIFLKLNLSSRAAATAYAYQQNLV